MVYIKYDLWYSIKWHKGGTSMGSLDYPNEDLDKVFEQLHGEVIIPSLTDPITDEITESPENMKTISISIRKKRVKT